jgi:uncharacterized membrane protein
MKSDFVSGGARYLHWGRKRVVREFSNRRGLSILAVLSVVMVIFLLLFAFDILRIEF